MSPKPPAGPVESLTLIRAALRHRDLTDRERVVLAELASHDPTRFVPTLSVLARSLWGGDSRRHRDHARKMLRQLEDKGVLQVEYGKAGQVVRYALSLGDAEPASGRKRLSRVTPAERQVTPSQRRGDAGPAGLSTNIKNNPRKRIRGGYVGNDAQSASPMNTKITSEDKAILTLLKNRPDGMPVQSIANELSRKALDVQQDCTRLKQLGHIRTELDGRCHYQTKKSR